ncbi:MAG: hypothetical protein M9962_02100 [Oligoflexia bacterium]|nr:hypothetical protein [Oligoflexia bacterium]
MGIIMGMVWLSFSTHSLYRLIGDIIISVGIGLSLCVAVGSLICLIPLVVYLIVDIGTHLYFRSVDIKNVSEEIFKPHNIILGLFFFSILTSVGFFIGKNILSESLAFDGVVKSIADLGDLYRKSLIENMLFTSVTTLTILSVSMAGFLLNKKDD